MERRSSDANRSDSKRWLLCEGLRLYGCGFNRRYSGYSFCDLRSPYFSEECENSPREFVLQLHNSFFVDSTFKRVRKIIDGTEEEESEYRKLIDEHDEDFIDFLNYFELIAYLQAEKNISLKDVEALAGYYLRIINQRPALRKYVGEKSLSFEHFQRLLDKIKM